MADSKLPDIPAGKNYPKIKVPYSENINIIFFPQNIYGQQDLIFERVNKKGDKAYIVVYSKAEANNINTLQLVLEYNNGVLSKKSLQFTDIKNKYETCLLYILFSLRRIRNNNKIKGFRTFHEDNSIIVQLNNDIKNIYKYYREFYNNSVNLSRKWYDTWRSNVYSILQRYTSYMKTDIRFVTLIHDDVATIFESIRDLILYAQGFVAKEQKLLPKKLIPIENLQINVNNLKDRVKRIKPPDVSISDTNFDETTRQIILDEYNDSITNAEQYKNIRSAYSNDVQQKSVIIDQGLHEVYNEMYGIQLNTEIPSPLEEEEEEEGEFVDIARMSESAQDSLNNVKDKQDNIQIAQVVDNINVTQQNINNVDNAITAQNQAQQNLVDDLEELVEVTENKVNMVNRAILEIEELNKTISNLEFLVLNAHNEQVRLDLEETLFRTTQRRNGLQSLIDEFQNEQSDIINTIIGMQQTTNELLNTEQQIKDSINTRAQELEVSKEQSKQKVSDNPIPQYIPLNAAFSVLSGNPDIIPVNIPTISLPPLRGVDSEPSNNANNGGVGDNAPLTDRLYNIVYGLPLLSFGGATALSILNEYQILDSLYKWSISVLDSINIFNIVSQRLSRLRDIVSTLGTPVTLPVQLSIQYVAEPAIKGLLYFPSQLFETAADIDEIYRSYVFTQLEEPVLQAVVIEGSKGNPEEPQGTVAQSSFDLYNILATIIRFIADYETTYSVVLLFLWGILLYLIYKKTRSKD